MGKNNYIFNVNYIVLFNRIFFGKVLKLCIGCRWKKKDRIVLSYDVVLIKWEEEVVSRILVEKLCLFIGVWLIFFRD